MTGMDVARLREVAEKATPGPWEAVTGKGPKRRLQQTALVGVADLRGQGEKGCIAVFAGMNKHRADDAEFVATFDPPTVLALLDALADREARLVGSAEAHERLREDEERLIQIEIAALRTGHVGMAEVFGVFERILAARLADQDEAQLERVERMLCERHQAASPTRQPCAACTQDASAALHPDPSEAKA